jgi:hypothetical protein
MNARTSAGFGAASLITSLLGCATAPAPAPPPAGTPPPIVEARCELNGRTFKQTSPGPCGSSEWHFVPQPDGSWQASESGCANATGIARYDGSAVNLEFQYAGGAGRYIWPLDAQCRGLVGTVTWTQGPLTGQTVASTLAVAQ